MEQTKLIIQMQRQFLALRRLHMFGVKIALPRFESESF